MKTIIVFGCGRFGSTVAVTLTELGNEVLAIDENYDKIKAISDQVTTAVQCDIMDETSVEDLGLKNFDIAIVAIGSNLEASIMATMLSKEAEIPFIVCKALTERHGSILEKLGGNKIIYPERDMAHRVAHNLTSSNILDYIQISKEFAIIESTVLKQWIGKSILELDIRNKHGVTIVAIERDDNIIVSPLASEVLREDDLVILLGSGENVKKVEGQNV